MAVDFPFAVEFDILTTGGSSSFGGRAGVGLGDGVGKLSDLQNSVYLELYRQSNSDNRNLLDKKESGTYTLIGNAYSGSINTVFHNRLIYDGTNAILEDYSDAERTNLLGSVSGALTVPSGGYGYFYIISSLDGESGQYISGWIDNVRVLKLADPVNFTSITDYVEESEEDGGGGEEENALTIYVTEKMTQKRAPFFILFDLPFIPQERSELLLPKAIGGYDLYKFILTEPIDQEDLYAVLYVLTEDGITKHLLKYGANTEYGQYYLDNLEPMLVYKPGLNQNRDFKILLVQHPLWWERIAWWLGFLPKLESWG